MTVAATTDCLHPRILDNNRVIIFTSSQPEPQQDFTKGARQ